MTRMFRFTAAVVPLTLLTACLSGGIAEEATERMIENQAGENVDVEMRGDAMEITTDDGTMVAGSGELQEGWPEDVPTYPGATVSYSALVSDTGGPGAAAILTTPDAVADVAAHLRAELEGSGWSVTGSYDLGALHSIVAEKDGRVYSAAIQGGENGTTLTIGVGQQ